MPWEIDYALLTFTTLKKSSYNLPKDISISINSALNLSSELIDWDKSKLPKEYFIEKYKNISTLLEDYPHSSKIYEGDENYGHLNLQKDSISQEIDYYICLCPDQCFDEYLLNYLTQAAQLISNKYFTLTPQISKMWDPTWDVLTHPSYLNIPYHEWDKAINVYDTYHLSYTTENVQISPVNQYKWAGWFDLFNKLAFEELFEIPIEWNGYGGWDNYGMVVATHASKLNIDFQQYCLEGKITFEYSIGSLKTDNIDGFCKYYKNLIHRKDPLLKLQKFNEELPFYIKKQINKINQLK
jgi:hypothetical protein